MLRGSITQDQADERVAFLANRQRLLEQKSPPIIHAAMDQSCLARPIGGREVMFEQLSHLEHLAVRPNITVQIAPFSLGEHRPFTLPVVLLTLPDHTVVGYTESQARGYLERAREAVAAWERDYDQLQVESLSKARPWPRSATFERTLRMHDLADASWLKSSHSDNGGSCVEVAPGFPGAVPVRDSKDPEGPALIFSTEAFAVFVAGVRNGEFGEV
ncbi:hypothetical protein GCM10010430_02930 [Kitasatospora cystarginea]|uniref:DUF397 domain-containing protein n=1 Tax=Kitasatospora cystarginea TaxID=58350 RepID=A0ABP5Q8K4_9ACTN